MAHDTVCPECGHNSVPDLGEYTGCLHCGWRPEKPKKLTRMEKLQELADRGIDTWEDYRGEK